MLQKLPGFFILVGVCTGCSSSVSTKTSGGSGATDTVSAETESGGAEADPSGGATQAPGDSDGTAGGGDSDDAESQSDDADPTGGGATDAAADTGDEGGDEGGAPSPPPNFRDVAPASVKTISESSVRLTWTAPAEAVTRYEVYVSATKSAEPDFSAPPLMASIPGNAVATDVTGLTPGVVGKLRLRAILSAPTGNVTGPSSTYWTPFGTINQPNVNGTTATHTGLYTSYVESAYISDSFSILTGHFYVPEISYVFNKVPANGEMPLYSLGARTIKTTGGFDNKGLADYGQIWSDGTKMAIPQSWGPSRILIYNQLPSSPDKATPALVLGQTDMANIGANAGLGSVNDKGFDRPGAACFNGTTFYVADQFNNRIMGWNGWPTATGQSADFVLGQPDFSSNAANNGGLGPTSLNAPSTLDCSGGRLIVVDGGNNRVLIWNTAPTANGAVPNAILGQSSDSAGGANGAGGASAGGLNVPTGLKVMTHNGSSYLLVSEWGNNRVVQWDAIPTSGYGAVPDRVYGQPDLTSVAANAGGVKGPSTLSGSHQISEQVGSDRFWVSDFMNGRFVIFQLNNPTAVGVWGHEDGTSTVSAWGTYSATRHSPSTIWYRWTGFESGGPELAIDRETGIAAMSNRIWSEAPKASAEAPSFFRGAPDLNHGSIANESATSGNVNSVVTIAGRTYWADTERVLSKAGTFTGNADAADLILGHKDLNGATVTATTNDYKIAPTKLARTGATLLVLDPPRIVGYSTPAAGSNQQVSFAIGQSNLTNKIANDGGVSASTLSDTVLDMIVADGKMFVADTSNNRVLIYNDVATSLATGTAASIVLGQSAMTLAAEGSGLGGMRRPTGVAVIDGRLFVADMGNKRLLIWDELPTTSGEAADREVDVTSTFSFDLPSWYDKDALAISSINHYDGAIYLGTYDRVLVVPDLF